jgi:hypothetical protein
VLILNILKQREHLFSSKLCGIKFQTSNFTPFFDYQHIPNENFHVQKSKLQLKLRLSPNENCQDWKSTISLKSISNLIENGHLYENVPLELRSYDTFIVMWSSQEITFKLDTEQEVWLCDSMTACSSRVRSFVIILIGIASLPWSSEFSSLNFLYKFKDYFSTLRIICGHDPMSKALSTVLVSYRTLEMVAKVAPERF